MGNLEVKIYFEQDDDLLKARLQDQVISQPDVMDHLLQVLHTLPLFKAPKGITWTPELEAYSTRTSHLTPPRPQGLAFGFPL